MSILLAMGSDIDTRLVRRLLEPLNEPITVADSAIEAQRWALTGPVKVIVVDVASLEGDWLELVRVVARERGEGFVLVLHPSNDVMDKARALEEGADDYLVYPYEPAELLARIKAALRRHSRYARAFHGNLVRVGRAQLDVHELEISVPGRARIRLTPNEMRLLLYLMTHADRTVDQHELLTHLFGSDTRQVASNAVGVYMRRVRRKIEQNPDQPCYLVTVRGHGYQFKAADEEDTPMSS
jgi:DNA-binding response OmpR family regulator